MKVVQVRPSHVRLFYSRLSKQKYSHSTIKFLHNMILPSFEVAVDDDIIRKNPAKRTLGDYGEPEKKRTALSFEQQKNLLNYVKNSEVFHIYLPLLQVMIGTGLRCGELIGLTWKDVDLKTRTVYVNHQLIYKNYGDGCDFHVTMCFLASNFPHFYRYDSLKSALYIHAVLKNINTFPKNQGRIRAAIAVEILDFTVMYR